LGRNLLNVVAYRVLEKLGSSFHSLWSADGFGLAT
jgi:hypothetical protein